MHGALLPHPVVHVQEAYCQLCPDPNKDMGEGGSSTDWQCSAALARPWKYCIPLYGMPTVCHHYMHIYHLYWARVGPCGLAQALLQYRALQWQIHNKYWRYLNILSVCGSLQSLESACCSLSLCRARHAGVGLAKPCTYQLCINACMSIIHHEIERYPTKLYLVRFHRNQASVVDKQ
jgi:hypothetical protein